MQNAESFLDEAPSGAEAFLDEEEDTNWASYIPTAVRVGGSVVSGVVGAVPSPITTPTAALLGAGAETLAQAEEIRQGTREAINPKTVAVEAALSAVPFGAVAKGASALRAATTVGIKAGALSAAGTQARSLTETGELASVGETAVSAGLGAAAGGGLALAARGLGKMSAKKAATFLDESPPTTKAAEAPTPLSRAEDFLDDVPQSPEHVLENVEAALPDTRVRGETGKVKRLFHGTGRDFDDFAIDAADEDALFGPGVYLTDDPEIAGEYARAAMYRPSVGRISEESIAEHYTPGAIVRSYSGFDRVVEFHPTTDKAGWSVDVISVKEDGSPIPGELVRTHFTEPKLSVQPNVRPVYANITNPLDATTTEGKNVYNDLVQQYESKVEVREALIELGYDGIKYRGGLITGGDNHDVWVALSPDQVKPASAIEAGVGSQVELGLARAGLRDPRRGPRTPTESFLDEHPNTIKDMDRMLFDRDGRVRPEKLELLETRATEESTAVMTDAVRAKGIEAAEALAKTPAAARNERLYKQVADAFAVGDLDAEELAPALARSNLTMEEFIRDFYEPAIRTGARQMNQLSRLSKELKKHSGIDPKFAEFVDKAAAEQSAFDKGLAAIHKVEDFRRASLTGQVATAARNAVSQAPRYGVDVLDLAIKDALAPLFGREATGAAEDAVASMGRALTGKQNKAALEKMFSEVPATAQKLFGDYEFASNNPVLTATLGKYQKAISYLNRTQEGFYRRAKADAVIRTGLRNLGIDYAAAVDNPKLIPPGLLEKAAREAMTVTFSGRPSSAAGRQLLHGFNILRPISTLVTPFPRYTAEAMKFLTTHSPAGMLRLLTKAGRANAPEIAAEATTGTLVLLSGALALRFSPYAGEKSYEVNVGGKTLDLRGFAGPFAPYLFAGELIRKDAEGDTREMDRQEWVEGLLSMRRLGGTLAAIIDWSRGRASGKKIVGEWLSGFTVPLRTLKDVVAAVDPEEAKHRDLKDDPLLGPSRVNIPFAARGLPESFSSTRAGPKSAENTLLRQLTGASVTTQNDLEVELKRLGVDPYELTEKVGVGKVDRQLQRRLGILAEKYGPGLMKDPRYVAADDAGKIKMMKSIYKEMRARAREDLKKTNPLLGGAIDAMRGTGKIGKEIAARGLDKKKKAQEWADKAEDR